MNDIRPNEKSPPSPSFDEKLQILHMIEAYIQSINCGKLTDGANLFATEDSTVFIHPRGTERGWNKIAKDIYGFFEHTFSVRDLTITDGPHVHIFGDAAVADFEWDFRAVFRENGEPLHTTGRESQVFRKLASKDWRIVHVHYSGPPVTGEGEGF